MNRAKSFSLLPQPRHTFGRSSSGNRLSVRDTPISSRLSATRKLSSAQKPPSVSRLTNDKRWVNEQHAKVIEFIEDNAELFDSQIVNVNNLKPMTTSAFVHIMSVLFQIVLPRRKIAMDNYKEVIPLQLKMLNFPGQISNNTIKAVNTMHAFPQVVSMMSWLIKLVNVLNSQGRPTKHLSPEDKKKVAVTQASLKYLIASHSNFNNNYSEEGDGTNDELDRNQERLDQQYREEVAAAINLDLNTHNTIKDELQRMEEKLKSQESLFMKKKDHCQKMELKTSTLREQVSQFYAEDATREQAMEETLNKLNQKKAKQLEQIQQCRADIDQLHEVMKHQPCTYKEKRELQQQIESLKFSNGLKMEKMEVMKKVKDEYNFKLTEYLRDMEKMVHKWNNSLIKLTVECPDIKTCLLREKDLCNEDFIQEIEDILKKAKVLKESYETQITKMHKLKETETITVEKLKSQIAEKNEQTKVLEKLVHDGKQKLQQVEETAEKRKNELETKMIVINQQIQELQEENFEDLENNIRELKTMNENLRRDVEEYSAKSLSFFVQFHKQVMQNLAKMDKIKGDIIQSVLTGIMERQKFIE